MKTIGLIGGISWLSSAKYYHLINQAINEKLGGHASAQLILYSVNCANVVNPTLEESWPSTERVLIKAAQSLEKAGADIILIACNSVHKIAEQIQNAISIPILHIVDVTAHAIKKDGLHTVGLLGTAVSLTDNFYKDCLSQHQIKIILPSPSQIKSIDSIIFKELCFNKMNHESLKIMQTVICEMMNKGAQAIILGCTELGLLIEQPFNVRLYDTTRLHANAAVELSLAD